MHFLNSGTLWLEFAVNKQFATIAVGLKMEFRAFSLVFPKHLRNVLLNLMQSGQVFLGRGGGSDQFRQKCTENWIFLSKWMVVSFFLESLKLAYIPSELVGNLFGNSG